MADTNVGKYLEGIDYPATKNDIVKKAKENKAPEEVVNALNQLPEEEYGDQMEVIAAMGGGEVGGEEE